MLVKGLAAKAEDLKRAIERAQCSSESRANLRAIQVHRDAHPSRIHLLYIITIFLMENVLFAEKFTYNDKFGALLKK